MNADEHRSAAATRLDRCESGRGAGSACPAPPHGAEGAGERQPAGGPAGRAVRLRVVLAEPPPPRHRFDIVLALPRPKMLRQILHQ